MTHLPSATELSGRLAGGGADARELAEAALDGAARSRATFIVLTEQTALAEADAAAVRGAARTRRGPLDGVPVAWKDLFDIAGKRTTAGSACLAGAPPATRDAAAVAALRRAGAVAIGKTNLSEFAFSGLGLNPHFGTPTVSRPGVSTRAPGGSSSGSALAVHAGIVPIGMGTDTAGSIRIPAAFNGLVGYKSSTLRYDMTGVFPLAATFDSLGPITRSVADCVLVDQALRGAAHTVERSAIDRHTFVIDSGILADAVVTDVVRDNLLATMERLARGGARVVTRHVAAITETRAWLDRLGWAGAAEGYRFHAERLAGPDRELIDPRILARLELGRSMTPERYRQLLDIRREMQARIVGELAGDVLVTPTVGHVAPELAPLEADPETFASVNIATLRLTMIGSFLDTPALAIPSGTDADGLPTSLQFSVPSGDDERLLAVGLRLDDLLG